MNLKAEKIKINSMKLLLFNFIFNSSWKKNPFTHIVKNNEVIFKWRSKKPDSNSLFFLERKKSDSSQWSQVDFIDNTHSSYSSGIYLHDLNVPEGEYYYRLKKKDENDSIQYFDVDLPVKIFEEQEINTNPTEDKISLYHYSNLLKTEIIIKFILPRPTPAKLTVYNDTLGEINILVNKKLKAGAYKFIFPITNDELCSFNIYYELCAYGINKLMEMTPEINNIRNYFRTPKLIAPII